MSAPPLVCMFILFDYCNGLKQILQGGFPRHTNSANLPYPKYLISVSFTKTEICSLPYVGILTAVYHAGDEIWFSFNYFSFCFAFFSNLSHFFRKKLHFSYNIFGSFKIFSESNKAIGMTVTIKIYDSYSRTRILRHLNGPEDSC